MNYQFYNVVGVMSGTSLDGVDLVHITFHFKEKISYKIIHAQTVPYTKDMQLRLKEALTLSKGQIETLNKHYTKYLSNVINNFIAGNNIKNLNAVCSHGHTIFHDPQHGYTLQIGNLKELATFINQRVVCDFRVQDVQLGGQGAPLVPIGDALLFSNYDYCINLGGFANISFDNNSRRLAYDICPVNVIMNTYASMLDKEFDEGGAFAKAGKIHLNVVKQLNALVYYDLPLPKSLGMEWVNENMSPILRQIEKPEDILATFTEHIAIQIATHLEGSGQALITGGGAYNHYLLEQISSKTNVQLIVPDSITVEFKEAIIFGLLGVLRLRNGVNCLSSVTGASQDHSSGMVYTC